MSESVGGIYREVCGCGDWLGELVACSDAVACSASSGAGVLGRVGRAPSCAGALGRVGRAPSCNCLGSTPGSPSTSSNSSPTGEGAGGKCFGGRCCAVSATGGSVLGEHFLSLSKCTTSRLRGVRECFIRYTASESLQTTLKGPVHGQ